MFKTERLIIEKTKKNEIPALVKIEHDPDNCRFTWTASVEEHEKELENESILTLIIKRKEDKKIVGYMILDKDLKANRLGLRRWALSEKGCGYGKEIMLSLLDYSFNVMNMNKVWLEAYEDNYVGRKLYENVGFKLDGVLRQHEKKERGIIGMAQYSILREEYNML